MPAGAEQACPRCGAARGEAPECARCGVVFAKLAHAVERPEHLAPETPVWSGAVEDARLEVKLRYAAVPAALAFGALAVHALHFLVRTFLSMWVHETGHAVTAWFCGYPAFPGPWRTPVGQQRSFVVVALLLTALGTWLYRRARDQKWGAASAAAMLIALQLALTLMLSPTHAQALFTFGGDGGCLVLGTLLMTTFYLPAEHPLRREWLRWGFLIIGAAAYCDAFGTWWAARSNSDAIPFGEIEGVGLSDPSKLTEVYGWSVHQVVSRYLVLAFACLAALTVVYLVGLASAKRALERSAPRPKGRLV